MPSSSARCAQLPRAADKVPFYAALKKFRDYLNGIVTSIDESEVVFSDSRLKNCCESESKASSLYSMELMDLSNAVVKKDEIIPCKKKRGRPKKIKVEGEETKLVTCKTTQSVPNCDFPKKKRGRPKKIKCEDSEIPVQERNAHTPISKCFSSPSPIQSPTNFYHMTPQMTSPNSGSNMYNNPMPISHQPYSQSPRPHSQPFTHSDLSSEISAAISSDQLGSPAPTSPSLGPPDFDPPTSMPTEDAIECRFSSPAPSTASEQPSAVPLGSSTPYPTYHTFAIETDGNYPQSSNAPSAIHRPSSVTDYKVEDVSSKSLSGLESLVDQIPNIAEGEVPHGVEVMSVPGENAGEQYPGVYPGYSSAGRLSPAAGQPYGTYGCPSGSYGPTLPVPALPTYGNSANAYGNMFEHHGMPQMPVALPPPPVYGGYGQPYVGGPPPGLHVPSPSYPPPPPYYDTAPYAHTQSGPARSPAPPSYLHNHLFDRIKPDIGYGSF